MRAVVEPDRLPRGGALKQLSQEGNALRAFKNDFVNKLMFALNAMGRRDDCRAFFARWRDGGGAATMQNYAGYFFALTKLPLNPGEATPALDAFEALWARIKPPAQVSGDAGGIFANAACVAALLGEREGMLRLIRDALGLAFPPAKIAADPDFRAYEDDADFVALGSGNAPG